MRSYANRLGYLNTHQTDFYLVLPYVSIQFIVIDRGLVGEIYLGLDSLRTDIVCIVCMKGAPPR